MPIHVILEFDTREEAIEALGGIEARNIVDWFDDQELKGNPHDGPIEALELETLGRRSA